VPEEATRLQPRRKILRVIIAVLGLVVIVAAGIYGLSGSSRLNRQLADLRSRGLPTNGEELNAYYAVPSDVAELRNIGQQPPKRTIPTRSTRKPWAFRSL
jgi:hypothetical protein